MSSFGACSLGRNRVDASAVVGWILPCASLQFHTPLHPKRYSTWCKRVDCGPGMWLPAVALVPGHSPDWKMIAGETALPTRNRR